jgi:hypothetical protein
MDEARASFEAAWAIREAGEVEPTHRAETAWMLAQVLADDPVRARALVVTGRELFAGMQKVAEVKTMDTWLAEHPAGR